MSEEEEVLAVIRARSRRAVHQVLVGLAIAASAAALAFHHAPLGLPADIASDVAKGFLATGAAYLATIFVWDWIFSDDNG